MKYDLGGPALLAYDAEHGQRTLVERFRFRIWRTVGSSIWDDVLKHFRFNSEMHASLRDHVIMRDHET